MIVVTSIQAPIVKAIPSLSPDAARDTGMSVSVDESAGAEIVVRVVGTIGSSDVPLLAETLGEAAERERSLILDLSSVTGVAEGVRSVLDATAIRLGRWNQTIAVALSPALEQSEADLVPPRIEVRRTPAGSAAAEIR